MKLDPEKTINRAIALLKRNKNAFTDCDIKLERHDKGEYNEVVRVTITDLTNNNRRAVDMRVKSFDTDDDVWKPENHPQWLEDACGANRVKAPEKKVLLRFAYTLWEQWCGLDYNRKNNFVEY